MRTARTLKDLEWVEETHKGMCVRERGMYSKRDLVDLNEIQNRLLNKKDEIKL